MTQSALSDSKSFLLSLGLHVAVVALAVVGSELIQKIFGNNDIEIIRSSIRVDVVGMPKFTVQELKELEKKSAEIPKEPEVAKGEKAPTKTDSEDVIKDGDLVIQEKGKEKKKSSFLSTLNEYSNKKIDKKNTKTGKSSATGDKNLEALVLEGNKLSQGSALTGDFTDGPSSEFSSYVQTLPGAIRGKWRLPTYLLEQNLKARVKIYISTTGELLKTEIIESSGNNEFDSRAVNAIRESAPFAAPPETVGVRLTRYGVILGFPL